MRFHTTHVRDSSLRRLRRINRWMIAASVALTGLFTEAAAHAFPGKSTTKPASANKRAHSHHSHHAHSSAPKSTTAPTDAAPTRKCAAGDRRIRAAAPNPNAAKHPLKNPRPKARTAQHRPHRPRRNRKSPTKALPNPLPNANRRLPSFPGAREMGGRPSTGGDGGRARWEALGTLVDVRVERPRRSARRARARSNASSHAIDLACSRFRCDSELSRLNARAGQCVQVSALLLEALDLALAAATAHRRRRRPDRRAGARAGRL